MKNFEELEGVVCKNKVEMLELATLAKNKGYEVDKILFEKPKYKNIIFYCGKFRTAVDYAIKKQITKEDFLIKLN